MLSKIVPVLVALVFSGSAEAKTAPEVICERVAACDCLTGTMSSCKQEMSRIDNLPFATCVTGASCDVVCDEPKAKERIAMCTAEHGGPEASQVRGQGSFSCTAEGTYEICTGPGMCQPLSATAMGRGASEAKARSNAELACAEHMATMIVTGNISSSASMRTPCSVKTCQRPGR
jgi:hypothetical protein